MSQVVVISVIVLSAIGILSAAILYYVAQKFKVEEDPRIDLVEATLPAANCGGCGYAGCRNFAEACVKADSLDGLFCPVGGNTCMSQVAAILGIAAVEQEARVAVIRCSGGPDVRPKQVHYQGIASCRFVVGQHVGENGCAFGCLGLGDCVTACTFNAIAINPLTSLPVVDDATCTACGACVTACPRGIIELRRKDKKDRKIFVSCVNRDKGPVASKNCQVACIGCKKCQKECPHDAIVVENFLAYIDPYKCKLCRKCVVVCPTSAILEVNFPPRKEKSAAVSSADDSSSPS